MRILLKIQDGAKKQPPFTVTKKAYDITYREKGYVVIEETEADEIAEASNQRPGENFGTFDPDKGKTLDSGDVSAKSIAESLGVETGTGTDEAKAGNTPGGGKELTAPNNKITATGKATASKTKLAPPTPKKAVGKSATRPNTRAADSGENRPATVITKTNESEIENKSTDDAGTSGGANGGAGTGGGDAGTVN